MPLVQSTDRQWLRVRKGRPCPICESLSWCLVSSDGSVALCMRVQSDKVKVMSNGEPAYIHRLTDAALPTIRQFRPVRKPSDTERHNILAPLCRSWFVARGQNLERLATQLGVAAWSLDALKVGWNEEEECWTFPEQNHAGLIVGCNRRFEDGRKLAVVGGGRGLNYADDWNDTPGPVLIVEGGSDAAAGLTLGLCVIGRPSCTGGVVYLTKLLDKQDGRRVVIVGERDWRQVENERHDTTCKCCGQCWPGRNGAIQTSIALSRRLDMIVQWTLLPDGAKDLRGWLNQQAAEPENEQAMLRLGASLARRLKRGLKE